MVERTPLGAVVSEDVMAVMRMHSKFEEKCPPGSVIMRRSNPYGGWRLEVWLGEDFLWEISYNDPLKGKPRDIKTRVARAARRAVTSQILGFKYYMTNTEVDHEVSFAKLWKDFLNDREAELYQDNRGEDHLVLEDEWMEYHREHARLQLLTPEEHARVTKKRRLS